MADLNQDSAELAETMKKLQEAFAKMGISIDETAQASARARAETNKTSDATIKAKYGVENFSKAADQGKTAISELAKGASAAAKAIYGNQQGAKAFSGTMDGMGSALTATTAAAGLLFPQFKLLAIGVGLATKAVVAYFKAAAEQSDSLFGTYQTLSKSGAAASDGMTGVFRDAQKLGLGFQGLGRYTQLIAESSKELALFGGSVTDGRKRFADIGLEMTQYRRGLMNLGMSQDEVNDGTMSYLRLQSRLGLTQTQSTNDLARSANAYLQEQDALTKLTGMSRKDQESAREEIRSQERFAAQLMEVRATKGEAAAIALENTYLVLKSQSKEAAQGFADVSTGMLTTEAAIKSYRATQGESMRTAQLVSDGQITAAEGAQRVAAAHGRTVTDMGMTMGKIGTYNKTYGDITGDLRLRGMAESDIAKQLAKVEKDRLAQGAAGNTAADKSTQAQTDLRLAQQQTMLAFQQFVNVGVGPVTKVLNGLASALESFAFGLAKVAKFFGLYDKPKSDKNIEVTKAEKNIDDAELKLREKQWAVANARGDAENKKAKIELAAAEIVLANAKTAKSVAQQAARGSPATTEFATNQGGAAVGYRRIRRNTAPAADAVGGVPAGPAAASDAVDANKTGASSTPAADKPAAAVAEKPIKLVLNTGNGFVTVETESGEAQRRVGARNWRNNNPGNLEFGSFAESKGAIGSDGRFAVFPTLEQGSKAKEDLLFGKNYANLSIEQAISKYAPPNENNTENYIKQILAATGANSNTILNDLTSSQRQSMLSAINRAEGFKEGKILQAAAGGMFSGPVSGYPATLHGNEAVIPLKNGAVPVKLDISDQLKSLQQTNNESSIEAAMQKMVDEFKSTMQITMETAMRAALGNSNMSAVTGVLNEMVTQQKNSNDIQSKILRAASV